MNSKKKENDFLIQCAASGVADFIYNKQNRASRWMDYKEKKLWLDGYNKAREACKR